MAKEITIDFEKFVHIFNTEGKEASEEFLATTYGAKYPNTIRLLKQSTNYRYNRGIKKYELRHDEGSDFISMEQLCEQNNAKATKVVASIPEKVYYSNPMDSLTIDLLQDRLLELTKFIKISVSSKTINIDINQLRDSGYDIQLID
ncbi:hypothetical protein [uncultured Clostridium sp.]|uniref:hypothetical protein n=1 Tax=uncultured Clostridium sp. TaxID=59620 RepID=UPI0032180293